MTVTHDYQTHQTWRVAYESLRAVLIDAQRQRDARREDDETGKPGWIEHESRVMLAEVNRLRRVFSKPPGTITREHIDAAERLALGHVDYTQKWAIACADLVIA